MNTDPFDFSEVEEVQRFSISNACAEKLCRSKYSNYRSIGFDSYLRANLSPTTEVIRTDDNTWTILTTCPEDVELLNDITLLTLKFGQ